MSSSNHLMECPICLDPWKEAEQILLCDIGHSVCLRCSLQISECPICRKPMTKKRNYDLEALSKSAQIMHESAKLKCTYTYVGCSYVLKNVQEKSAHETECRYKIFPCPGKTFCKLDCSWQGTSSEVYNHFQLMHEKDSALSFKGDLLFKDLNFDIPCTKVKIANAFKSSYIFLLKMDPAKKMAYCMFNFIGPKKFAEKYSYEFEIFSGLTRKFKVNEVCKSDGESLQDIISAGECVIIPYNVLISHLSLHKELTCRFRIIKAS